jgi:hypothetical protein
MLAASFLFPNFLLIDSSFVGAARAVTRASEESGKQ